MLGSTNVSLRPDSNLAELLPQRDPRIRPGAQSWAILHQRR